MCWEEQTPAPLPMPDPLLLPNSVLSQLICSTWSPCPRCSHTLTHSLSLLWFPSELSSNWGGTQPLQVTQHAPWTGKGATLDGCRSFVPAPPHGLALSLTHPVPSVGSPRAMVERSRGASWRVPTNRHVSEESPSVSAPSQPHHVLALDLNQAHAQVPAVPQDALRTLWGAQQAVLDTSWLHRTQKNLAAHHTLGHVAPGECSCPV